MGNGMANGMANGVGMGSKRTYENALRLLQTRRRNARPKNVISGDVIVRLEASLADKTPPPDATRSSTRGLPSLVGMNDWLQTVGYTPSDVAALNIIHIAGTKGKGSTCAFTQSLLQEHGKRTGFPTKIGLYTSPHLTCIRERIQINGQPISEDLFTKYFFDVWDRLFDHENNRASTNKPTRQPRYLQLLVLVAIHTFCQEGIQATIFETHHGGEYDATNLFTSPVVTGITSIGLDHLAQLGPDIETVAWHKAGIFKKGSSPAFSAPQSPPAVIEGVLRSRAAERGVRLEVVSADSNEILANITRSTDNNALFPPVQRVNSCLAIAIANSFLSKTSTSTGTRTSTRSNQDEKSLSQVDIRNGIANFSWPGRFEIIKSSSSSNNNKEEKITWYLDGAHNELSIGQAVDWFAAVVSSSSSSSSSTTHRHRYMIIFSHISETRDGPELLRSLGQAVQRHADTATIQAPQMVFTTYQERCAGNETNGNLIDNTNANDYNYTNDIHNLPKQYPDMWKSMMYSDCGGGGGGGSAIYIPSIEEALEYAQQVSTSIAAGDSTRTGTSTGTSTSSGNLHVLITGSLHLVGGALNLLRPAAAAAAVNPAETSTSN